MVTHVFLFFLGGDFFYIQALPCTTHIYQGVRGLIRRRVTPAHQVHESSLARGAKLSLPRFNPPSLTHAMLTNTSARFPFLRAFLPRSESWTAYPCLVGSSTFVYCARCQQQSFSQSSIHCLQQKWKPTANRSVDVTIDAGGSNSAPTCSLPALPLPGPTWFRT